MRALAMALVLMLAGCSAPVEETQDVIEETVPEPPLPEPLDLSMSLGPATPVFREGYCPQAGDCITRTFELTSPATMQVDLEVTSGELSWEMYQGENELQDQVISGAWKAERHLAAGQYDIVLSSTGPVPTALTGTVSWYHAFPPGGNVTVPDDIHDEGWWTTGFANVYDADGTCTDCLTYAFTVEGDGYATVSMKAALYWEEWPSMGSLLIRQGDETLASTPYGFPSTDRTILLDLFPGDYEVEVGGISHRDQEWIVAIEFQ